MAAFSFQHYPSLPDSIFFPNTPSKMSAFLEEPNTTPTCFYQFHQPDPSQEIPVCVHKSYCLEHSNSGVGIGNNESSVTNKQSKDSSSVLEEKLESGEQVSQKVIPMEKKRKNRDGSSLNSAQSKDIREVKGKKQKKSNGIVMKDAEEKKPTADKKDEKKIPEEAPTGYIHVRARRGQATDSHSLAERARREKISERMKLLQALVPGCDKVTGKALMLDEIINYVQSLQNQVEFLSMKLASASPMFYDFGGMDLDAFMFKPDQQCSQIQPTAISDTTYTANNYPLPDSPILFQQGQTPNSQCNGLLLWNVDDQRQKNTNQFGLRNNLCSFH